MKKLIALLVLIVFFVSCARSKAINTEQRLSNFYSYYFVEMDKGLNVTISEDTLNKYFTTAFLKSIPKRTEQCDCDPISQTQDYDADWTKTLTVNQPTKDKEYIVCFIADEKYCFKVIIQYVNGVPKISDVRHIDD